ncbi:MAG: S8 family peptidase [Candidatus Bipolaricaulota bacterium]|nr:S8 family peptidase [Candidatus Bipolaricaulota bacterium]
MSGRLRADGFVLFALVLLLLLGSASSLPPRDSLSSSSSLQNYSEGYHYSAKLDPFLKILAQRAAESARALHLAPFAHVIAVYESTALASARPLSPTAARQTDPQQIGVLVQTSRPLHPHDLPGLHTLERLTEDLYSARVAPQQLRELAALPHVVFVEANYRLAPQTDVSVPAVGGRFLHETAPAATGAGVIVGIVDTGFDFTHRDFRHDRDGDGVEESSRIVWLWDQTETGYFGSPQRVPFGTEYTREDLERALRGALGSVPQRDEQGHGTHVAGTAIGDGSASGGLYVGMAPQAEMIAVKTSYFSQDIIEGTRYIFEKAQWLGRPAVVNLSLGGHFGPHDGTSLLERGLESFLDRPGRVIVASAGNDGDRPVHIGGRLAPRESFTFTFVPNEETALLTIWYSGEANLLVSVASPGLRGPSQAALAVRGSSASAQTPDGRIYVDNSSGGPDPRNRDRAISISLESVQPGTPWKITLNDQGTGAKFDAWPGLSTMGYFVEGDSDKTVTEPATAEKIIAVGAYTTKIYWTGADGLPHRFLDLQSEGDLARFSARGPTRDGRLKPDLVAPGTAIVSALAKESELASNDKLVLPGREYVAMQGTSMAAPHVAGAVALLLQANPRLTVAEIRRQLTQTALQDAFTQKGPLMGWGAGKLQIARGFDGLGLVEQLQQGRPALKIGPNPALDKTVFFYAVGPKPAQSVELLVFDLVGRRVFRQALLPQGQRFEWRLLDEEGRRLPPGLYIALLRADGRSSLPQRLIIQR